MNRQQFLNELRNCLEGEVTNQVMNENLSYYDQYFKEQMAAGKSEEEIAAQLGNPILTARTVIDAAAADHDNEYEETIYTEDGEEAPHTSTEFKTFEFKWYHKLLIILIIVAVVSLIFTITGAILSFAAPFLLVILLIYVIRRLFS